MQNTRDEKKRRQSCSPPMAPEGKRSKSDGHRYLSSLDLPIPRKSTNTPPARNYPGYMAMAPPVQRLPTPTPVEVRRASSRDGSRGHQVLHRPGRVGRMAAARAVQSLQASATVEVNRASSRDGSRGHQVLRRPGQGGRMAAARAVQSLPRSATDEENRASSREVLSRQGGRMVASPSVQHLSTSATVEVHRASSRDGSRGHQVLRPVQGGRMAAARAVQRLETSATVEVRRASSRDGSRGHQVLHRPGRGGRMAASPAVQRRSESSASKAYPEGYAEPLPTMEDQRLLEQATPEYYCEQPETTEFRRFLEQEMELYEKDMREGQKESLISDQGYETLRFYAKELERQELKKKRNQQIIMERKDRFIERFVTIYAGIAGRTIAKDRVALALAFDAEFIPPEVRLRDFDVMVYLPELVVNVDNNDDEFDAYLEEMNAADFQSSCDCDTAFELDEW